MIEHKLIRVESDAPNRCQGIFTGGQCPYRAIKDTQYCEMHSISQAKVLEAKSLKNYRLGQWQARMTEFSDNQQIKSIREEIGILRLILETMMNKCQSDTDLLLYSGKISDMVMKLDRLVSTCQKMESTLGIMMDKIAAMQLANEIVTIISEHVSDAAIVALIADKIGLAVDQAGSRI